jgi:alanine racemase
MKRSARITIHPEALQHNLNRAKQIAPQSKLLAVIKANAYGHGSVETAGILYDIADGFAVSCIPEAVVLRDAGIDLPITVLQGHQTADDLHIAAQLKLRLTVHEENQLYLLDNYSQQHKFEINLKIDSGMHRLGFQANQTASLFNKLKNHSQVNPKELILMTHFSCADDLQNSYTTKQLECFEVACANLDAPKSIANSAGILGWKTSHADWVRPGIMLYGSSPFSTKSASEYDLQATMTFEAPVVSVHNLKKGDSIGYAATWQCPKDMNVAVVACGYADGYPRHAKNGTPVWVNGHETELLGRVSMDMIVLSADKHDSHHEKIIKVGDNAELWGNNLAVDRVASAAETIAYEILCNAGNIRT